MTVLLVDDNKEIRELEKSLFASLFDTFYESASGEEAITLFNRYKPDWVLMDFKMGKMNGIDAMKEIKEKHPEAKIIIVTQYDDNFLRNAAITSGAETYILKENLLAVQDFINNYRGVLK